MGSSGTYLLRHQGRSSPAILVRHSYGGTLITIDPSAAAALEPDANEISQGQQALFSVTDVFSRIDVADGHV